VKRALDSVDPDPFIKWKDLKMGKTRASRLGPSVPKPAGTADDLEIIEVGHEFMDNLTSTTWRSLRPTTFRFLILSHHCFLVAVFLSILNV
jgi:hypothetical protein